MRPENSAWIAGEPILPTKEELNQFAAQWFNKHEFGFNSRLGLGKEAHCSLLYYGYPAGPTEKKIAFEAEIRPHINDLKFTGVGGRLEPLGPTSIVLMLDCPQIQAKHRELYLRFSEMARVPDDIGGISHTPHITIADYKDTGSREWVFWRLPEQVKAHFVGRIVQLEKFVLYDH